MVLFGAECSFDSVWVLEEEILLLNLHSQNQTIPTVTQHRIIQLGIQNLTHLNIHIQNSNQLNSHCLAQIQPQSQFLAFTPSSLLFSATPTQPNPTQQLCCPTSHNQPMDIMLIPLCFSVFSVGIFEQDSSPHPVVCIQHSAYFLAPPGPSPLSHPPLRILKDS